MDSILPFNTFTITLSGLAVIGSTFVRHYVKRKEVTAQQEVRNSLLFDEAFSVMKKFFEKSALHTVEETQTFGNNFVPAPFWVRVIRVVIPLSSRLEAGKIIISTLGEDEIQAVIGGREWWQRTAHKEAGVDGEWISLKKDWQGLEREAKEKQKNEAEKKGKTPQEWEDELRAEKLKQLKEKTKEENRRRRKEGKARNADPSISANTRTTETDDETSDIETEQEAEERAAEGQRRANGDDADSIPFYENDEYSGELDDMPVCLYLFGGGYFFGSVNTHRYILWRIARKMGGRVFAPKYRLAPQYPFPCALHDALSAYLYLIHPPPSAKHRAVDPAKIVIGGDSAGGGLALALLCLIRDAGLPAPAGGILLSPWCDLTHSFPSILQNTETDIPPAYGFSQFKPSTLWPPPPPEFRKRAAQSTSIEGLKLAARKYAHSHFSPSASSAGATPSSEHRHHHLSFNTHKKGLELAGAVEKLPEADPQRAEQHRTQAKPEGEGEEGKGEIGRVIKVKVDGEMVELADQIQLYATNDQLIYPFVSPAFAPSLGGLPPLYVMAGDKEVLRDEIIFMAHRAANPEKYSVRKGILEANPERAEKGKTYPPTKVHLQVYDDVCHDLPLFSFTNPAKYCFRAIASFAKFVTAGPNEQAAAVSATDMELPVERDPTHPDANGLLSPPSSHRNSTSVLPVGSTSTLSALPHTHGGKKVHNLEKTIYLGTQPFNRPDYIDNMIRERVSITGVVRPMEPQADMQALTLDPEDIGLIKESPVKRYLAGKAIWDKKFKNEYKRVQKRREKHLRMAMREEAKRVTKRVSELQKEKKKGSGSGSSTSTQQSGADTGALERITDSPEPLDLAENELGLGGIWNLHGEHPPPSSIAARKDTGEARRLANTLEEHYSRLHALNLWSGLHDVVGHLPRQQTTDDSDPASSSPQTSTSPQ
ncbi:hypothetical protein JCM21900_004847 [Sporobolomyces salmonicolor]